MYRRPHWSRLLVQAAWKKLKLNYNNMKVLALFALAAALVLTGCGGGGETAAPTAPATTNAPAAPAK